MQSLKNLQKKKNISLRPQRIGLGIEQNMYKNTQNTQNTQNNNNNTIIGICKEYMIPILSKHENLFNFNSIHSSKYYNDPNDTYYNECVEYTRQKTEFIKPQNISGTYKPQTAKKLFTHFTSQFITIETLDKLDNPDNIDNIDNIDNSKHLNAYNVDNETIDALEHNTILDIMDDKQIQTEDDSFTVYTRKKNSKRTPKSLEFLSGKLIDDDTTMN